jgi:hypothetical protein
MGLNVKKTRKSFFNSVLLNTISKYFFDQKRMIVLSLTFFFLIQGVFEMSAEILITSYWLHVEFGKNIKKNLSKNKCIFIF